tara:strand:+ start:2429 stop:2617 length:189 start_codon:yes stop_codon:yes gene_type:complete
MTKKEIRGVFKSAGVQLGADALVLIEEDMKKKVNLMAKRCKDGNVKRLTSETYFIAIGKVRF